MIFLDENIANNMVYFDILTTHLYQPLLYQNLIHGTKCLHKADEWKSLLLGQH